MADYALAAENAKLRDCLRIAVIIIDGLCGQQAMPDPKMDERIAGLRKVAEALEPPPNNQEYGQ